EGSPSGRFIQAFNPNTFALIRTITPPSSFTFGAANATRSIAVDSAGYLYLNQLYGPVYKLTPDGQHVVTSGSYTQSSYVDDMDFSGDGQFMITQFDGRVCILDSNLQQIRTFNTTNYYFSQSFGSFVELPEPLFSLPVAAAACLILQRPFRRPKQN